MTQAAPRVSILMVSYNTREHTLEALRCALEQTRSPAEVIVVDNASADGSAKAIRERFPEVTLLPEAINLGFGNAVNLAAQRASAPYLLLLNPDTRVLDGAIDRLLAFADAHPAAGIYGGVTCYEDGSDNPESCWNRPTLWSTACQATGLAALFPGSAWLNPERVRFPANRQPFEVDIVTGCFLLVRRDLWERLGGFDPAFFVYGEDFDLCLRARALGCRPLVLPSARLVHFGGASERVAADRLVRLLRSKVLLFEKHWSAGAARGGSALLLLWALSRRIGYRVQGWLGNRSAGSKAATWDEVWRRSPEFLGARGAPLSPSAERP
jgi:GT2 family glycosyltransferase